MSTRSFMHALVSLLLAGMSGCHTLDIDRLQRDIRDVYRQGADSTVAIAGMPYNEAAKLSRGTDVIVGVIMDGSGTDTLQLVRGHFHGYTEPIEDTAAIIARIERLKPAVAGTDSLSLYRASTRESALAGLHYRAVEVDPSESTDRFDLLKIDMDNVAFIVDVDAQDNYSSGRSPEATVLIVLLGLLILSVSVLGILFSGTSDSTGCGCAVLLGVGGLIGVVMLLM